MKTKQSLRILGEKELINVVINDETLYPQRHRPFFIKLIDELFDYDMVQLAELNRYLFEEHKPGQGE